MSSKWSTLSPSLPPPQQRSLASHIITVASSPGYAVVDGDVDGLSSCLKVVSGQQGLKGADNDLRRELFKHRLEQGDYSGAAQALAELRIDEGAPAGDPYYFTAAEITDTYVTVAECHLEDDDPIPAETFVNKAGTAVDRLDRENQGDRALLLRYGSALARVLDANRKFLSAAERYYSLSQTDDGNVVEGDLLMLLGKAVTCAVLAPSGAQRTKVLGLVAADERLAGLDGLDGFTGHARVARKMKKMEIIRPGDMREFTNSLQPHQNVKMADGMTVVQRAVVEHNMVAIGRVYGSIRLVDLGEILDIDGVKAMGIAAKLIGSGAFGGSIDEVDGLLTFEEANPSDASSSIIADVALGLSQCADRAAQLMAGK